MTAGEKVCIASSPSSAGATLHPAFRSPGRRIGATLSARETILDSIPRKSPTGLQCGPRGTHSESVARPRVRVPRKLSSGKSTSMCSDTSPEVHLDELGRPPSLVSTRRGQASVYRLKLSAHRADYGEAKEQMDVDYAAEEIAIGFNSR